MKTCSSRRVLHHPSCPVAGALSPARRTDERRACRVRDTQRRQLCSHCQSSEVRALVIAIHVSHMHACARGACTHKQHRGASCPRRGWQKPASAAQDLGLGLPSPDQLPCDLSGMLGRQHERWRRCPGAQHRASPGGSWVRRYFVSVAPLDPPAGRRETESSQCGITVAMPSA